MPRFLPEADMHSGGLVFLPARSFTFQRRQQLVLVHPHSSDWGRYTLLHTCPRWHCYMRCGSAFCVLGSSRWSNVVVDLAVCQFLVDTRSTGLISRSELPYDAESMVEAVNDDGRYLETHEGELYKGKTVRGWPGPARTRDRSCEDVGCVTWAVGDERGRTGLGTGVYEGHGSPGFGGANDSSLLFVYRVFGPIIHLIHLIYPVPTHMIRLSQARRLPAKRYRPQDVASRHRSVVSFNSSHRLCGFHGYTFCLYCQGSCVLLEFRSREISTCVMNAHVGGSNIHINPGEAKGFPCCLCGHVWQEPRGLVSGGLVDDV